MIGKFTRRSVLVAGLLATAACSRPPAETIAAGEQAQQSAIAAGAEEYASEAMAAVTAARASLDAELQVQQERFALRRSYRRAGELATAYRQASEQALGAASVGREQVREQATTLIEESKSLLEEVRGMLATAPVGKGSRADLAALRADLDQAGTLITEAEGSLGSQEFMDAKVKATSAHELIDRVKAAIDQARGLQAG